MYSVGEQLQKSVQGPSKLGRAIKITLILICVIGIPGLIGASFFIRVGKRKEYTAAGRFWKMVKDLGDYFSGPTDPDFTLVKIAVERIEYMPAGTHEYQTHEF